MVAGGIALVTVLSGNRPLAGPDWWTDAPWTNGTLNVCADISKGAYDTCPTKLRILLSLNASFWTSILTAAARAGGSPSKGPVADQSADEAPVQIREGRTLVCTPESLRSEAQDWSRKLAQHATNDVRVLLCDSMCQDQELCGKRTFRHLGAFRKSQTNR